MVPFVPEEEHILVTLKKRKEKQVEPKSLNSGWVPYGSSYDSFPKAASHPGFRKVKFYVKDQHRSNLLVYPMSYWVARLLIK